MPPSCHESPGPSRCPESLGAADLSNPFPVGRRHDDVHDLVDVVVHRGYQPKKLRPLLRRRHNPVGIDSCARYVNLSIEQPQLGVVPGMQSRQDFRAGCGETQRSPCWGSGLRTMTRRIITISLLRRTRCSPAWRSGVLTPLERPAAFCLTHW